MTNKISLKGWAVVVTRPAHQARPICDLVVQLGGEVTSTPAIQILPPNNTKYFDECLQRQTGYDISIFVSQNAVSSVFNRLEALNLQWYGDTVAVGAATACTLSSRVTNIIVPADDDYRSEGVLKELSKRDLKGLKMVIYRAQTGRDWLKQQLKRLGAEVNYVEAYRRLPVTQLIERATFEQYAASTRLISLCNSVESVQYFISRLDSEAKDIIGNAPMVVPSERVGHEAKEFINNVIVAKSALDEDMLAAIPRLG